MRCTNCTRDQFCHISCVLCTQRYFRSQVVIYKWWTLQMQSRSGTMLFPQSERTTLFLCKSKVDHSVCVCKQQTVKGPNEKMQSEALSQNLWKRKYTEKTRGHHRLWWRFTQNMLKVVRGHADHAHVSHSWERNSLQFPWFLGWMSSFKGWKREDLRGLRQ